MPKVEITRLGARHNRKPVGEVGEVVEVDERLAAAMERYGWAKPAEDEAPEKPEAEKPEDTRETADSADAANRETRGPGRPKRGPGRPPKSDN